MDEFKDEVYMSDFCGTRFSLSKVIKFLAFGLSTKKAAEN